ncbi:MAG TPA: YqgE/AlgH family protein [Prolixibacteraceae bacterium]|nr:YqgE/AlgH family protein [Prolixibacteraceae bacterium]
MNLNLDIFKIRTNNVTPRKGRILIAEPFLPGSYFNRSIVFLVEHNKEGSVGFILNKPVDFPVDEFYKEFPNYHHTLYMGGPVNIESVYFIHTLGTKIPGSAHVMENLYWGGDFDVLKQLIRSGKATPREVRFFLGYSGWSENQLSEELEEDSWLVSDIDTELVMKNNETMWKEMVKQVGGRYLLWENYPENPSMN